MKSRKGFTLIELLVVIAIIAILAAILFPVFVRAKAAAMASHCQSNMNQIGKAMKMYLSDWEDTHPTNRPFTPMSNPPVLWNINYYVPLTDPNKTEASTGEAWRFQYGYSWVEGIYPYVEKVTEGDAASAWKCPAAKSAEFTGNGIQGKWPAVTYAFNRNLIEMPEGVVKNSGNLMMLRELDRKYNSVTRPLYECVASNQIPQDPFLGPEDGVKTKFKLHGDGSIILFADGHVKVFSTAYFTNSKQGQSEWDAQNNQWYNWVSAPSSDAKNFSIAISP
jgi:prepilin-type N-terminal cleavage/methylation domain-containing protein/prepilin-type processing-associated H-X9-DG protein